MAARRDSDAQLLHEVREARHVRLQEFRRGLVCNCARLINQSFLKGKIRLPSKNLCAHGAQNLSKVELCGNRAHRQCQALARL